MQNSPTQVLVLSVWDVCIYIHVCEYDSFHSKCNIPKIHQIEIEKLEFPKYLAV